MTTVTHSLEMANDFSLPIRIFNNGTRERPRSDNEYSTFGGIWGNSLRKIRPSASNSFNMMLSVLKEMVPILRFSSLCRITLFSDSQYIMIILYLPLINDNVYPKPVSFSSTPVGTQVLRTSNTLL